MADQGRRRRNAARIIAPVALLAVAGVTYGMVSRFTGESEGDNGDQGRTSEQTGTETTPRQGEGRPPPQRRFYLVKLNDTLGLISEKTGVSVERLQELNPELDPQNLIVGQRVKLRE